VLYVGPGKAAVTPYSDTVKPVSTVKNPGGFPGIGTGISVWRCSGRHTPRAQLWPKLRRMG
jgi:hypothetical protein